jgi:hypothetical protein
MVTGNTSTVLGQKEAATDIYGTSVASNVQSITSLTGKVVQYRILTLIEVDPSATADGTDTQTMLWRLLDDANEVWQNPDRAAIIALLRGAPTGMRAGLIADHLEKKEVAVRAILSRMVREGQINLIDRGLYEIK